MKYPIMWYIHEQRRGWFWKINKTKQNHCKAMKSAGVVCVQQKGGSPPPTPQNDERLKKKKIENNFLKDEMATTGAQYVFQARNSHLKPTDLGSKLKFLQHDKKKRTGCL